MAVSRSLVLLVLALLRTGALQSAPGYGEEADSESESEVDVDVDVDEYQSEEEAVRCKCSLPDCMDTEGVCSSTAQSCFMRIEQASLTAVLGCVDSVGPKGCVNLNMRTDVDDELEIYLEAGELNRTYCCDTDMCNLQLQKVLTAFHKQTRLRLAPGARTVVQSSSSTTPVVDNQQTTVSWLMAAAILVPLFSLLVLAGLVYLAVRIWRGGSTRTDKLDWMNLHVNLHLPLPENTNSPPKCAKRKHRLDYDYVFTIVPTATTPTPQRCDPRHTPWPRGSTGARAPYLRAADMQVHSGLHSYTAPVPDTTDSVATRTSPGAGSNSSSTCSFNF